MNYVIVGVGAAGITAAKEIRKKDESADITMISPDHSVHSRCMLHYYISGERSEEEIGFTEEDFFKKNRISWVRQPVTGIDTKSKRVILANGTNETQTNGTQTNENSINYDKLLLATGANSFIPPVPGFRTAGNVYGLRHLSDAVSITEEALGMKRAVVIGAGLVGLDAAYGLLKRGLAVDIVEMGDRILPLQLDSHAALEYKRRFEAAGAVFHLGKKARDTTVGNDGRLTGVILDDGTHLELDFLVVTAGVRPAVSFLAESGIICDRGITVDEYLRTNIEDVFAAGDVTGLSGIWPNAALQGKTAAANMCGMKEAYEDRYAIKNTINFFGLPSLCIGSFTPNDGDRTFIKEDRNSYKKMVLRDGRPVGVLFQGDISHAGIWQYLIKNGLSIPNTEDPFSVSYGMYYHVKDNGEYSYP